MSKIEKSFQLKFFQLLHYVLKDEQQEVLLFRGKAHTKFSQNNKTLLIVTPYQRKEALK